MKNNFFETLFGFNNKTQDSLEVSNSQINDLYDDLFIDDVLLSNNCPEGKPGCTLNEKM